MGSDIVDPERIYLSPECCSDPREGREWCKDNVWPESGDCDVPGTEYVRADLVATLTRERDEAQAKLAAMRSPEMMERIKARLDHLVDTGRRDTRQMAAAIQTMLGETE